MWVRGSVMVRSTWISVQGGLCDISMAANARPHPAYSLRQLPLSLTYMIKNSKNTNNDNKLSFKKRVGCEHKGMGAFGR